MSGANEPDNESPDGGDRRPVPVNRDTTTALARAQDRYPGSYGVHDQYLGPPDRAAAGGNELAELIYWLLRLVLKRRWLIAAVTVLFVIVGSLNSLMRTPLYVATVRIQIDDQALKIVDGDTSGRATIGSASEFLRTQYALLHSRSLADRVVSALQLHDDDEFFAPRKVSLTGVVREAIAGERKAERVPSPIAMQSWAIGIVQANIAVRPVSGSRLVDLSYKDPSPRRAQRIANAYADAFIAANLDKRFQANAYAKTFLEDQIAQLKIRLEKSEKELIEFAKRERVVVLGERASIAESNLAAANVSLGALVSERIKNEQLWRQVELSDGINVPELLKNKVIDGLRARRNALTSEYEEKLEIFKPGYPEMVKILNKIKEVDRQLASEVSTVRASLKSAYETSLAEEREMRSRIEKLRAGVLDFQKRRAQHNILLREVETNKKLYNSLLQRLRELGVASGVGTNNVFIVDKAEAPGVPSEPRLSRALFFAFGLGVGGGIGLAYLLELLDDRLRTPEDVEELTGLTTLGIIPRAPSDEDFQANLTETHSAIAEAHRSLATALQFSSETGLPRSILLTSAGPSEGKSSTAIALARQYANMGLKVLLVDADLRKPSLHTKLNYDNSMGLSNYLTGSVAPPETFQETDTPSLTFMASGPVPPNAADLLSGTRMYSLVSVGLEIFDLIIIDGPPMLGLADAQLLSSATSVTLLVVGAGMQPKGAVRNTIRRLDMARANVVGFALTRFDASHAAYQGYAYSYSYGAGAYEYGATRAADPPTETIADTTDAPPTHQPQVDDPQRDDPQSDESQTYDSQNDGPQTNVADKPAEDMFGDEARSGEARTPEANDPRGS
ncbi:MAG: polysaccharide biosynthesis tyrosine autokinase [Pseudomonadota bacterium]